MNLEKLTASGKADLSLLAAPLSEPSLSWIPIGEEMIDLAVPPQRSAWPRATSDPVRPITIDEIRTKRLLSSKGQGFRKLTFDICREAGFEPNVVFESGNIETLQSLVATGMGITLVPRFIARAKRASLFLSTCRSLIRFRAARWLWLTATAAICPKRRMRSSILLNRSWTSWLWRAFRTSARRP